MKFQIKETVDKVEEKEQVLEFSTKIDHDGGFVVMVREICDTDRLWNLLKVSVKSRKLHRYASVGEIGLVVNANKQIEFDD